MRFRTPFAIPLSLCFGVCKLVNSAANKDIFPVYEYCPIDTRFALQLDFRRPMEDYFTALQRGAIVVLPREKSSDRSYRMRCLLAAVVFGTLVIYLGSLDTKLQSSIRGHAVVLSVKQHQAQALIGRTKHGSAKSRRGARRRLAGTHSKIATLKKQIKAKKTIQLFLRLGIVAGIIVASILGLMGLLIAKWKRETIQARMAGGNILDFVNTMHMFSLNWCSSKELSLGDTRFILKEQKKYWHFRNKNYRELYAVDWGGQEIWRWHYVPMLEGSYKYVYEFLESLRQHLSVFPLASASQDDEHSASGFGPAAANDPRWQR